MLWQDGGQLLWTNRRHREPVTILAPGGGKLLTGSAKSIFLCDAELGHVTGQDEVKDTYYPGKELDQGQVLTPSMQRHTHGHLE